MTVTDPTRTPSRLPSDVPRRRATGLVPHREPGSCTAPRRCARSRSSRGAIAEQLGPRCRSTLRLVWKPVLTGSAAIRRACLDANGDDRCIGVIAWMHTFSPAKMWIHGLDELRKPLLHLHTQANEALPWSTIDMDFMNLNQAAHGDREFAHVADPSRRRRARPSPATSAIPTVHAPRGDVGAAQRRRPRRCATCAWSASATTCATSP